ncbi:Tyrosine recombinase XerC [Paracoccus haematequi]|uniref:Tyrosine recombinase XerC n=1 Tax=Paracoccus haematequi TaxID=2491866 RepID=A0A447IJ54_9RHOB|nr:tyrosine-type recombinase/integrase [Paracoccus haematequi]VDS07527.1 Tyrosine recombinase XerC [Paracoccus haematequi]
MRQAVWGGKLKGIRRQKRGDKIVRYHRATGIRLPDLPETHPDFVTEWAKAEAKAKSPLETAQRRKPVLPGQIAAAVRDMLHGAWFRGKSPTYQGMMRRHAEDIAAKYGTGKIKAVTAHNIETDLGKLDPNPANDRLKVWRALMNHAKVTPNPALEVKRRTVRVIGFAAWDSDDIALFRARWKIGTPARAAFELLYWTAARTNDAVLIGPGNIGPDGILSFVQSKTGGRAYVPWSNRLPEFAEGWEDEREAVKSALLGSSATFLAVAGKPRSVKGLGNLIADAARDAGLIDRTAHGLRKARLTAIAEAGGTSHAIMAWGGHASLAEVEHYTRAAKMRRLVSREQGRNVVS